MSEVVTVHSASSSVEAEALRGWLVEQGIECRIDDPRDSAYPGILDRGGRWRLLVAAGNEDAAREAIVAWNAAEIAGGDGPYRGDAEPEEPMTGPTPSQLARRSIGKRFVFGAVLVGSLCANFYLSLTNFALDRDYVEERRSREAVERSYDRLSTESSQNTAAVQSRLEFAVEAERIRLDRCRVELSRATGTPL
ncbi:MAG: hypothetical protein ACI9KE_000011 [Polyangiales bacterium]|jgi:hypothetical protein